MTRSAREQKQKQKQNQKKRKLQQLWPRKILEAPKRRENQKNKNQKNKTKITIPAPRRLGSRNGDFRFGFLFFGFWFSRRFGASRILRGRNGDSRFLFCFCFWVFSGASALFSLADRMKHPVPSPCASCVALLPVSPSVFVSLFVSAARPQMRKPNTSCGFFLGRLLTNCSYCSHGV